MDRKGQKLHWQFKIFVLLLIFYLGEVSACYEIWLLVIILSYCSVIDIYMLQFISKQFGAIAQNEKRYAK